MEIRIRSAVTFQGLPAATRTMVSCSRRVSLKRFAAVANFSGMKISVDIASIREGTDFVSVKTIFFEIFQSVGVGLTEGVNLGQLVADSVVQPVAGLADEKAVDLKPASCLNNFQKKIGRAHV